MTDLPEKPAFLRHLEWVTTLLSRICVVLAGSAIVIMTVIFAWLVFGRYVLNDTPTWVEQVSLLLVMVIAFFGAAVGVEQDTHLSVVLFFGGLMFWYGLELTRFKWNTLIPLIQWSEGLRSLPLTICGALIFLFSTGHLIRLLLGRDNRVDSIE